MKKIMISLLMTTSWLVAHEWKEIDFDVSMKTKNYPEAVAATTRIIGIEGTLLLDHYRMLYERFNQARKSPSPTVKIPKIIHHIWLGSPLPDSLKAYVASWREKHGDEWEYILWTDEEVKKLGLYNQEFYDATDNYGTKSDIVRWELLYRFGGVYVDTDFEDLQSLEYLHYVCDFYTGIQPLDTYFVQLGAALVGSVSGHPLLWHCIKTIRDDWHFKGAPTKTGPVHFTKSFFAVAGLDGSIDVAFPASYFYPLGCRDRSYNPARWIAQGSCAVHHWAKSWMPSEYRPTQFRDIDNAASTVNWNG